MKIALLGDIALIGKYDLSKNPEAFRRLDVVKAYLGQFDYVIGNLESPLTDVTKSWIPKSMHLRSSRKNVDILKYLGVKAVSIANNHVYDFGQKGFAETIETLEQNGIEWCGAYGKDVQIRLEGEFINVSGFCCASTNGVHLGNANVNKNTIHLLNRYNVEKQLQKDNEQKAFSLIIPHWGQEHTSYPGKDTIKIARKIAGMKSNLAIVAHHPHQIQGIEKFNDNLIAYSLGNFLFDDCVSLNGKMVLKQNENNKKTCVIALNISNKKLTDYQIQGFVDDDNLGVIPVDSCSEFKMISDKIAKCESKEYQELRLSQIRQVTMLKFGRHNLSWLVSRLNYSSIGAKLLTYVMKHKYNCVVNDFVDS